jgi:hypothetical protein
VGVSHELEVGAEALPVAQLGVVVLVEVAELAAELRGDLGALEVEFEGVGVFVRIKEGGNIDAVR